jgi:hypothetical protein
MAVSRSLGLGFVALASRMRSHRVDSPRTLLVPMSMIST